MGWSTAQQKIKLAVTQAEEESGITVTHFLFQTRRSISVPCNLDCHGRIVWFSSFAVVSLNNVKQIVQYLYKNNNRGFAIVYIKHNKIVFSYLFGTILGLHWVPQTSIHHFPFLSLSSNEPVILCIWTKSSRSVLVLYRKGRETLGWWIVCTFYFVNCLLCTGL